MVKGNWERRAELANQRRDAAKARKTAKSTKATPVQAVIALLQKMLPVDAIVTVWLATYPPVVACSPWLRHGYCEDKKCRLAHEPMSNLLTQTIGLVTDTSSVTIAASSNSTFVDHACLEPSTLSVWELDSESEDASRIQFIAYCAPIPDINADSTKIKTLLPVKPQAKQQLLYDHLFPEVWAAFKQSFKERQECSEDSQQGHILSTIREEKVPIPSRGIDNISRFNSNVGSIEEEVLKPHTTQPAVISFGGGSVCPLLSVGTRVNKLIMGNIVSIIATFLPDEEFSCLLSTAKAVRSMWLADPLLRRRHREVCAAREAERLRLRSEEKKQRKKQAHLRKNSKVDAFARGGATGR